MQVYGVINISHAVSWMGHLCTKDKTVDVKSHRYTLASVALYSTQVFAKNNSMHKRRVSIHKGHLMRSFTFSF